MTHECPECGMVCDCDGEDVWQDAPIDCSHYEECELLADDAGSDEYDPDFDFGEDPDEAMPHADTCTCEHCIQDHPERDPASYDVE